ncbi:alanyl-tRNA editing protein Aarsd1-B-like [Daphnia pulex]|uniref:alanyl-tRNA editing protein Aarsd1-B-like n=1 Tax=Daphnia pulex TaxID=6669 RepID=UPI001EDF73E0|nr:alanyl-tRNA editing protein Aarsd1-B-like [Daphnia pulex]
MVFECQKSPYKKEFTSKVVSCSPCQIERLVQGKKEKVQAFEVLLEDTVFFPEGGGQPDDRGFLNGIPVFQVKRRGKDAIHFLQDSLDVGTLATGVIDWERRWDHMQQHSGQHLITAIADASFGFKTTSWWLGESVSHIELDTVNLTDAQLKTIESQVNEKIREAVSVEVKVYEGDAIPDQVRSRGLPDDHVGPVRVVTILGVDSNMCCGTHVSNLSHLQFIKLLYAEKGKKNKTNLFFISGNRVLDYINRSLDRERQLTKILKNGPEDHVDLANKLQASVKLSQKTLQTLMKELAVNQAEKIKTEKPKFSIVHRKDGDADYASALISELASEDITLLITVGEDNNGQMTLIGQEDVVSSLGPKICSCLAGKGAGKGKRFQAKVTQLNPSARQEAETILRDYFQ